MRNSGRIFLVIALLIAACSFTLFAQAKGGGATTGTGTVPTPGPVTTTTPPINTQPQPTTTRQPEFSRPMYVSGRVVTEDGTPPPQSVTIVRICNGVTRAMGYTDTKGHFSFDMNHADNAFQDASTPGMMSMGGDPTSTRASLDDPFSNMRGSSGMSGGGGSNSSVLLGCELRAQLPGYRSSAVQLAQRRSMDDPDVGMITLHRMSKDEGSTVSMTSMMAPKDARKAFDKGLEALKKKKDDEAGKEFQKAVTAYPQYAEAWFRLGALQMNRQEVEAARKSFAQAIAADPKLVSPYVDLALLDARENKWKETADSTAKAIRLDPVDFPVIFNLDALANYNLQNFDAAEKSAVQLQKLDTQHRYPLGTRILAAILADKKDYSGAAQQLRMFLKFAPPGKEADEARGQLQQLDKLVTAQAEPAPSGELVPKDQ